MRRFPLILPIATAITLAAWNHLQDRELGVIQNEIARLEGVKNAIMRDAGDAAPAAQEEGDEAAREGAGRMDWVALGRRFEKLAAGDQPGIIRETMTLAEDLQMRPALELIDGLARIEESAIAAKAADLLGGTILDALIRKDPETTFLTYSQRIFRDDYFGLQLPRAFAEWGRSNPLEVAGWMDEQVAAGLFDPKRLDGANRWYLQYESIVVSSGLSGDPESVGGRLSALPEEVRSEVLGRVSLDPAAAPLYADLIRTSGLDSGRTAALWAHATRELGSGGHEAISRFLAAANATPRERRAAVEGGAAAELNRRANFQKVELEDVRRLRQWVAIESPGSEDLVTAKLLGDLPLRGNPAITFTEVAEMARRFAAETPNDDLIIAFLEAGVAVNHKEQARSILAEIADPEIRTRLSKRFE